MTTAVSTPSSGVDAAERARRGDAASIAVALGEARERTLAMLAAWRAQLGDELRIPEDETLNPLRWELGHIGWFEEWWLARNRDRHAGWRADPDVRRPASIQPHADRWYDSGKVEQLSRWTLDLPHVDRIVDDLAVQREATLALLRGHGRDEVDEDALYFFRLVLMHEHMHAEAWLMMAQQLGIAPGVTIDEAITDELAAPRRARNDGAALVVEAGAIELGATAPSGFIFDNEAGSRRETLAPFTIDAGAVSWRRFLAFIDAGGYDDVRWWDAEGRAWLEARGTSGTLHPHYLRRTHDGRWEQQRFDRWVDVDPNHAASHLSLYEAQAWCRWAGRALPTEAQWRAAQRRHGTAFRWGEVWEWTTSPFEPFDGFTPHPYRDYSQPWFDGRPVLKGACTWTHPNMRHPAYRNYFLPHRHDVLAGFRSVESAARGV